MTTVIGTKSRAYGGLKAGAPGPHSTTVLKSTSAARPRIFAGWKALAEAQRGRAILWLPLAVMLGAAIYFALPREPVFWAGPVLAGASAGAAAMLSRATSPSRQDWRLGACLLGAAACAVLCAGAIGFSAAQWRSNLLAQPAMPAQVGPVGVEGWVAEASMGASRPRLKILVRSIEGIKNPPRYVEVSTSEAGAIQPGRAVRCFAALRRPDPPLAPGAYDPAFNAYFERVGATGFSYGACRPALFGPPAHVWDAAALSIAAIRRAVTETIVYAAPGKGGAVAAALVTGDLSLIDPETTRAFRDSGLGHMLSVSGLHMGLVSGIVYATLHLLLALVPALALRFPVRKWAAGGALIATATYLVLSGASVPAQRSFVLIAVALGAVLVDRPAITMRGLAAAALIVTLLSPEAVATPGFQMSFAASAALVAAFEDHARRREGRPLAAPGLLIGGLQRAWDWLFGALLASVVAGLASDPFALMHFQRLTVYALPSNIIATPITSLLIAPAAIAGAVLSLLGWAEPAWRLMGDALDFLIAAARVFADRPEAVSYLPRPPEAAFGLWIFAIAWGCLWRGALRWAAIAPLCLGIAVYALTPRAAILVDGEARAVVARTEDGRWRVIAAPRADFERERLAQLAGLGPAQAERLAEPEACTSAFCHWRTPGGRTAFFVRSGQGWVSACSAGAIVIAPIDPPEGWAQRCRPTALVAKDRLRRHGGAAFTEQFSGVDVRFATGAARLWTAAAGR